MTYRPARYVYFLERADTGLVKIGCSAWPKFRRKEIEMIVKAPVELLAFAPAPNGFRDERRLHAQFEDERVEGEWFSPSEAVLAAIAHVQATATLPACDGEDRDALIIRRRKAGETLQSIANDVGLTRERVRQILHEAGVAKPRLHRAAA